MANHVGGVLLRAEDALAAGQADVLRLVVSLLEVAPDGASSRSRTHPRGSRSVQPLSDAGLQQPVLPPFCRIAQF